MTLGEQQKLFALHFGILLVWLYDNGYECSIDEVLRTHAQAAINAASGTGVVHSLHLLHLAGDLNIFKDGKFLTTVDEIRPVGEYWKSLHPLCRWGGDFHTRPDADHFSMEYQGVK